MKNKALRYGLISGFLCTAMMLATLPFEKYIGFDRSLYVGYTVIVLSFLLVYFGVRAYREDEGQGEITFVKAFSIGIVITLITCVMYVATWEILYFTVLHGFYDHYAEYLKQKATAAGVSPAQIQKQLDDIKKFRTNYENPLYNSALTFLEPFPVGLAMTLLSAVLLRRKKKQSVRVTETAAAG